jgi:uncharacterized protein
MPRLVIGIMAKAPVAGFAKTRLIPLLGERGAARLQAALCEQTLRTCLPVAPAGVWIFSTGVGAEAYWRDCAETYPVRLVEQQGQTLGERMHHAISVLLERAPAALLVGTDCPSLRAAHLRRAAAALRGRRLVFIPALDGGYVLIGATEPCSPVFRDIAWGTAVVMDQTRAALSALGWQRDREWKELDPLPDLDEPADYLGAVRAGWVDPIRPQDGTRADGRLDIAGPQG